MTGMGELALILGLLVSAHCKVRARDPDISEEEEEIGGRAGGGGGLPPHQAMEPPLLAESGNYPARIGNWCCCPGHRGHNCKDTASDAQVDSGSSPPNGQSEFAALHPPGVQERLQQRLHLSREQSDQHRQHSQEHSREPLSVLPVPHMMALVMSQLQPILKGFNRSLEHLSRQVGHLARDVAQLKSSRLVEKRQVPLDGLEPGEAADEHLDANLDQVFQQMAAIRQQMERQRADVDNRLHSQHAVLHYNLTSFKADVDTELKQHQKMLQVSLQAMNATLTELKLDPDQLTEDHVPAPELPQPSDASALWEAIGRLDNMVVNNTVKVEGLMEDTEVTSGNVQLLRQDFKELEKQINQTARTSQVHFMETVLEVEAAKETVLRRVGELAGNLSQQGGQLQETEVDVDYLFSIVYKHNSSGDCDCAALKAAVARLEAGVANVTELANENRLTLDENSNGGAGQWVIADEWEPLVGVLQHGLQQVTQTLASEQSRTSTLNHSLAQLSSSVGVGLAEVSGLKEANRKLEATTQQLSAFFNSLLKDVIRHKDVLELLLGEAVLEFLVWPVQDLEAHTIPNLKKQLEHLQQQLRGHDLSITSLLGNRPGTREEMPSADQTSSPHQEDWLLGSMRRSSGGVSPREQQVVHHPEHRGDGGDLWNLEKRVDELGARVLRLEEEHANALTEREAPPEGAEASLQVEVTWLKRGLEEHLRTFKNVFSNADVLAGSDATLELDKVWQLVNNRNGKKQKKRGGGRREGSGRGGANQRSRRDSAGVPVLSGLSEGSLLLVAASPLKLSDSIVTLEASLNRGQFYSEAGTFTAPVNGLYLFVFTLDLRPGPAHVVLRRGSGAAAVNLRCQEVTEAGPVTSVGLLPLSDGEEVRLELEGARAESEEHVFTVLLLHRTT